MLYNYFIIALRNLFKSKVYTVINVSGLGIGIATVFLIIVYLRHELSYDRFHEKAENLYRVIWTGDNPQTRTPHPMAQAMKNDFPEVLNAVSLTPLYTAGLTPETHSFRNPESDIRYDERRILSVDTTFFDVFSFPLLKGNRETALKQVDGILISESMAGKYFGDEDPIGQHLAYTRDGLIFLMLGILIGIVAGIYPSLYLSKVRPHLILKGKLTTTPGGSAFRRGLIVFQFFISMMLISSAIIINQQLGFLSSKNLGFEKEAMLVIPVKNESGMDLFEALQTELLNIPGVASLSASSNIPGRQFNQHAIAPVEFPDQEVAASEVFVDFDFFHTLDIPLVEGRTFLRDNPSDSTGAFILNESAARGLNLKGTVTGREILWRRREDNSSYRGTVVGVVKDFHFQSLHEPIRPLLFALTHRQFNHILVKVDPEKFHQVIPAVEKSYKKFEQVYGFEFSFLEDQLNAQYASEERTAMILGIFTVLAILIAAFGLFGMSLLTFQQKVKELSVRKVLGASLPDILVLLVGDFTRLILAAVFLATPFAWFVMRNWLENFSYHIDVPAFTFILSGLALLLVAWLMLSYFAFRALQLNPAETLKNE
jgi:putative ABC transport system permease protein